MFMPERLVLIVLLSAASATAATGPAAADGIWALSLALQADDQDALAVQTGLSYGLSDQTWLSGNLGYTREATPPGEPAINSRAAGLGLDHDFGPLGIQLGLDYWGDPGELTRTGLKSGVYLGDESIRLSAEALYRDYTLTARLRDDQGNLLEAREFNMSGTGFGLGVRLGGSRVFGGLRGRWFDYSRDPEIFRSRTAFRTLSLSALTLANSFVDHRVEAGVGFAWGLNSLELELSRARSAVDGADIQVIAAYWVTPAGERTDLELSAGLYNPDGFDSSVFAGVALTWFGQRQSP